MIYGCGAAAGGIVWQRQSRIAALQFTPPPFFFNIL